VGERNRPVVGVVVPASGPLSKESAALLTKGLADAKAGRIRPVKGIADENERLRSQNDELREALRDIVGFGVAHDWHKRGMGQVLDRAADLLSRHAQATDGG